MYKIVLEMEVDSTFVSVFIAVPGMSHFSQTFRFTFDERYYYCKVGNESLQAKNLDELQEKIAKVLLSGLETQTQPWL